MTEATTDYPAAWLPKPGDKITGKIIDITAVDGGWGPYPCITLTDEAGTETAVHCFHTVLRQEVVKRRPKLGDELTITYLGKKGEGGRRGDGYEAYRVKGGESGEFNWDSMVSPEERSQAASEIPIIPANQVPPPTAQAATDPDPDDTDLPFLWREGSWGAVKHINRNPFVR